MGKLFNYFKELLFLSIFIYSSAFASDYLSPRIAALGGAGHAGPLLNDALYLNPSFASFLPTYSASFNYMTFSGGDANSPNAGHGMNWNFSLEDGRSELFQAGVGITRREDSRMIHVGASRSIVKRWGVGLGAKFLLPNNSSQNVARDMTFSTTGIVTDWFQAVVVVDNIFETPQDITAGLYREIILGTKFNIQGIALIYIDPHLAPNAPPSSYGHEIGIELTPMQDLFFRFGNFRNSNVPYAGVRGNGYGVGLGWIAPRVSFDYGLSKLLVPLDEIAHSFGMTIFM